MQRLIVSGIAALISSSISFAAVTPIQGRDIEGPSYPSTAQAQGLTAAEVETFERVRAAMVPFVDENISPLEVLGISAQSVEEKRQFAQRFVELQLAHTRAALEWAVFVEEAAERVNAREYIAQSDAINNALKAEKNRLKAEQRKYFGFDKKPIQSTAFQQALIAHRKVIFITPGCQQCNEMFQDILVDVKAGEVPAVDVVFADMGAEHSREISQWAASVGLDPSLTRARKVTLNFEGKRWRALRGSNALPYVASGLRNE